VNKQRGSQLLKNTNIGKQKSNSNKGRESVILSAKAIIIPEK